jgi:hypothetical protein
LYIAWKFDTADDRSATRVWNLLSRGHDRNLFRLRSRVIVNGELRALIAPAAPLDRIAAALGGLAATRWIDGERACAALAREIESAPVRLGLAQRPEQWPLSSAAAD